MRIDDIRTERQGDRLRIAATIIWEVRSQAPQLIYYETEDLPAAEFEANAATFLLATLPLAVWFGERRIRIGGPVCPRLRDGLHAMMALFHSWYPDKPPVSIDADAGYRPRLPRADRRTAAFLSGGIDSLALFQANRTEYPGGHPARFRDALFIFGLNTFDFDATGARPERVAAFNAYRNRLRELAAAMDVTLLSFATNVRSLYPDYTTWSGIGWTGGAFGIAHALGARVTDVWAGADGPGPHTEVRSQTQSLHLNLYSSTAVELHIGQLAMSRLEKTRMVTEWPAALARLRSCLNLQVLPADQLNCGRCEKCVRTMLALLALGKLGKGAPFPYRDVTPDLLEKLDGKTWAHALIYAEVIEPLQQQGRIDLVEPLRTKLEKLQANRSGSRVGWRERLGGWWRDRESRPATSG